MLSLEELVQEWVALQREVKATLANGKEITQEQRRRSISIQDRMLSFKYYEIDNEKKRQMS